MPRKFELLDAAKAPSAPRKFTDEQKEFNDYIAKLAPGKVGKLTLGQDESAFSCRSRVSRAAARMNRQVQTWVVDGAVYFSLRS